MTPAGKLLTPLRLIPLLGVMMFACLPARSQQPVYDSFAEQVFQRGVQAFDQGRYRAARVSFDSVIAMQPMNQRETAASIMRAKSLYAMNEYYDASKDGTLFSFPVSFFTVYRRRAPSSGAHLPAHRAIRRGARDGTAGMARGPGESAGIP